MHQPFYKDLISGEYKLPWTRIHALHDYYGMVKILEEFPEVHQTFNLVPSMLVQVEEYANGVANDPFLNAVLKPAEELTSEDQAFLLQHSFHAYPPRLIYRYPRYGEIYDAWQKSKSSGSGRHGFSAQEFRDLQVISQLAWFDEEFQAHDDDVRGLIEKGRDYTPLDQQLMGRKQREAIGKVIPQYRKMAATGQIEISTTPFYHPILPLLCDSNIASVAHPNVPLPPRFRYPQDARKQLEMARDFLEDRFGVTGQGLWPSEGSVSDEVFHLASELGFKWAATDSGVLARTLGGSLGVEQLYQPYVWRQDGKEIHAIFRDHLLSDLIGFVYSNMDAGHAADDFLRRIRENCAGILASGRDALVPIILDGENAWEYYYQTGRPFLRELYRRITQDASMRAVTVSEAFARIPSQPIDHIFPASWIGANFDVWIGAEEDNIAWKHLLRARETFDEVTTATTEQRKLAYEELLIAEGSDWNWWYGPEHDSANRIEFDQLYRSHLANVYRALGQAPPEELSRPILRITAEDVRIHPTDPIKPIIDGEVTSYFEWIGAGQYRAEERSGSMHGKKFVVRELYYGTDGAFLFVRIDFHPGMEAELHGMEVRLTVESARETLPAAVRLEHGAARPLQGVAECAYRGILEIKVAVKSPSLRFQLSLWQDGLPLDAVPQQGWLEIDPALWE